MAIPKKSRDQLFNLKKIIADKMGMKYVSDKDLNKKITWKQAELVRIKQAQRGSIFKSELKDILLGDFK